MTMTMAIPMKRMLSMMMVVVLLLMMMTMMMIVMTCDYDEDGDDSYGFLIDFYGSAYRFGCAVFCNMFMKSGVRCFFHGTQQGCPWPVG